MMIPHQCRLFCHSLQTTSLFFRLLYFHLCWLHHIIACVRDSNNTYNVHRNELFSFFLVFELKLTMNVVIVTIKFINGASIRTIVYIHHYIFLFSPLYQYFIEPNKHTSRQTASLSDGSRWLRGLSNRRVHEKKM